MGLCGYSLLPVLLFLLSGVHDASSYNPSNCLLNDVQGTWVFQVFEGQGPKDNRINCSKLGSPKNKVVIHLRGLNVAEDHISSSGFFTIIHKKGFEVVLNDHKWFAFFKYEGNYRHWTVYCNETFPGWVHDVQGKNWACFTAKKSSDENIRISEARHGQETNSNRREFGKPINRAQNSWTATGYEKSNVNQTMKRSCHSSFPRPKPVSMSQIMLHKAQTLPRSWDWRNVNGVNYVSPVRSHGNCYGSYAFASMAMLEARIRILTNNSQTPVLSTQQIFSCSEYSQGCEEGISYLTAGKYAQDFGIVEENCFPYLDGRATPCSPKNCPRYYVSEYHYVGGFYGACTEELMRLELVEHGPIVSLFEVYDDLPRHRKGIYHHKCNGGMFCNVKLINFEVLIIGYGTDEETGEDYWIVKDGLGTTWTETSGFFRVRRGTNECGIEGAAVAATPVPRL
ncbi:dipeptidyl peptidase 1 [Monodelphis domestica]|uniref:dipeptidyl peptidase 1 n=1 Tax=Monodelphis domestica TaxID=13616 RepID=UPI0024E2639D|nr:dipeptidyl peptidase 1 [Monodelphis domestica]